MDETVVVTGATGRQGGAVARALLAAGTPVRALVRNPRARGAIELERLGAQLVRGDLDDPASLRAVMEGARGLFSIQAPGPRRTPGDVHSDTELVRARNLAAAAAAARVGQVVHTSASGVTRLVDESRWGASMSHTFQVKTRAEEAMRETGAAAVTILRPAAFMENFLPPSYFYAPGSADRLLVAYDADSPQAFVAVADIARAAAAAFSEPETFDGVELELAGDKPTLREAVDLLTDAWNTPITLPENAAVAVAGLPDAIAQSQIYLSRHPAPARPEYASALGIPTASLKEWALGAAVTERGPESRP